jgi:DNA-binding transcriptional regulator YbjK
MSVFSRLRPREPATSVDHNAKGLEQFIADVRVGSHSTWTVVLRSVSSDETDAGAYRAARKRIATVAKRPEHANFVEDAVMRARQAADPVIRSSMVEITERHLTTFVTESSRIEMCQFLTDGAAAALALDGYIDPGDQALVLQPFDEIHGIGRISPD